MEVVWLTPAQQVYAEHIAQQRHHGAVSRNLPDRHGYTGNSLDAHRPGAYGEVAVAAWLFPDQYQCLTVDTFHTVPDLPGGIEVRAATRSTYRLLIRKGDNLDARWVSVVRAGAAWWLRGWLWGHQVQEEWLEAPVGREEAYFVPHAALRPMDELRTAAL